MAIIILGIVMSLTVGLFMAMAFTAGMKNNICRAIVTIIISLVIGFAITGMFYLEAKGDDERWNNGHCEICGGEWELNSVTKSRNGFKTYYWDCKDCGHVIETSTKFK